MKETCVDVWRTQGQGRSRQGGRGGCGTLGQPVRDCGEGQVTASQRLGDRSHGDTKEAAGTRKRYKFKAKIRGKHQTGKKRKNRNGSRDDAETPCLRGGRLGLSPLSRLTAPIGALSLLDAVSPTCDISRVEGTGSPCKQLGVGAQGHPRAGVPAPSRPLKPAVRRVHAGTPPELRRPSS